MPITSGSFPSFCFSVLYGTVEAPEPLTCGSLCLPMTEKLPSVVIVGRPTITTDGSFSVIGRHNEPQVRGSGASTVPYSTLKQKLGKFPLVMCIFRQMPKWGHKQFDQLA